MCAGEEERTNEKMYFYDLVNEFFRSLSAPRRNWTDRAPFEGVFQRRLQKPTYSWVHPPPKYCQKVIKMIVFCLFIITFLPLPFWEFCSLSHVFRYYRLVRFCTQFTNSRHQEKASKIRLDCDHLRTSISLEWLCGFLSIYLNCIIHPVSLSFSPVLFLSL